MRILVAIDGSPATETVIAEVARQPWTSSVEVRVVTVEVPVDPGLLRSGPSTIFDDLVHQQRLEAAQRLQTAVRKLRQLAPHLLVTSAILNGWPKDEIIVEAERWPADVVALGSHGYGPIRRLFLGSVSLFVVLNSPCSVLVVRQSTVDESAATAGTVTPQ